MEAEIANYYAAFVIGPDRHNIEVVCHQSEANQAMSSSGGVFEETHSPVLLPIARINPDFFFLGQGYPTNHFYISLASRS